MCCSAADLHEYETGDATYCATRYANGSMATSSLAPQKGSCSSESCTCDSIGSSLMPPHELQPAQEEAPGSTRGKVCYQDKASARTQSPTGTGTGTGCLHHKLQVCFLGEGMALLLYLRLYINNAHPCPDPRCCACHTALRLPLQSPHLAPAEAPSSTGGR